MLSPLSYDDVVPRPGIEPGERRLEGGAVVLHPRLVLFGAPPASRTLYSRVRSPRPGSAGRDMWFSGAPPTSRTLRVRSRSPEPGSARRGACLLEPSARVALAFRAYRARVVLLDHDGIGASRAAYWWSESDSNRSRARCELTLRACGRPMLLRTTGAHGRDRTCNLPEVSRVLGPSSCVGKTIEDGCRIPNEQVRCSA